MTQEQLNHLSEAVKEKYKDVFSPIPHLDDLSTDIYCHIKLKDTSKTFATQSYSTPHEYKEAWAELIKQHLDASHIHQILCMHPLHSSYQKPILWFYPDV